MSITVNIYYKGENGRARKFAKEEGISVIDEAALQIINDKRRNEKKK